MELYFVLKRLFQKEYRIYLRLKDDRLSSKIGSYFDKK